VKYNREEDETMTNSNSSPLAGSDGRPRALGVVADTHVVLEGGGVPVRRALPSNQVTYRLVDPFLLLDDFRADNLAPGSFPPHPHRGFEIITYFLKGSGHHSDDMGNDSTVRAGGLQRITAGRGMWHGEGPGAEPGPVWGLQLWINLAQAEKRIDPSYQAIAAEQIPEHSVGDATIRLLAGDGSPTVLRTPAVYYDVSLPPDGRTEIPLPEGFQGFIYLLSGDASFGANNQRATEGQIAALGEGAEIPVIAGAAGARFVLGAGQPHREPVRWNGPYVD
jgi:quercetin 2,3-dioxygenase